MKNTKIENEFEVLRKKFFIQKTVEFIYYTCKDTLDKESSNFNQFGLTVFCGMQGDGKTVSMVEQLNYLKKKYPKSKILTNFGYKGEHEQLTDWLQLLTERNGDEGIIFAIDEIQNEFNVFNARDLSLRILSVVTQQRKQKIKILATSQHFNRVVKQLREQTFEVVDCYTFAGRWTFQKCFNAQEYNAVIDNPDSKQKLRRKWRRNFVQTNKLRDSFDSYAVIESMIKLEEEERRKEKALVA